MLTDPPYYVAHEGKTAAALTVANDHMDPAAHRFPTGAPTAAGKHLRAVGGFGVVKEK